MTDPEERRRTGKYRNVMNKRIVYLILFGMVLLFTSHSLPAPVAAQENQLVLVSSGWQEPVKKLAEAYTRAGGPEIQFVKTDSPLKSRRKMMRGEADAMLTFDKYVKYYKSKIYAKSFTFLPLLYWEKGVVSHWNQFDFHQGLMVRGKPAKRIIRFAGFVHRNGKNILSDLEHITLSPPSQYVDQE